MCVIKVNRELQGKSNESQMTDVNQSATKFSVGGAQGKAEDRRRELDALKLENEQLVA